MRKLGCVVLAILLLGVFALPFVVRLQMQKRSLTAQGYRWQVFKSALPEGNKQYICSAAMSPSGSLFACAERHILRSKDGGRHWTHIDKGLDLYFPHAAVDKRGTVYVENGRMLYRSTDDGNNWQLMNDPKVKDIFEIATGPRGDITILRFVETQDKKEISRDFRKQAQKVEESAEIISDATTCGITSKGTQIGLTRYGICRLGKDENKRKYLVPELDERQNPNLITGLSSVAIDSQDRVYITIEYHNRTTDVSDKYILRSDDDGLHWKKLHISQLSKHGPFGEIANGYQDKIIMGTSEGLFISSDNGAHFAPVREFGWGFFDHFARNCILAVATGRDGKILAINYAGDVAIGTPIKQKRRLP